MPSLKVNGITFNYPDPGSPPGWGGEATSWAEEITTVLNGIVSPTDIAQVNISQGSGMLPGLLKNASQVFYVNVLVSIISNKNQANERITIEKLQILKPLGVLDVTIDPVVIRTAGTGAIDDTHTYTIDPNGQVAINFVSDPLTARDISYKILVSMENP